MQADDHRAARRDGGEVLLQPAELPLVEIPHIEVAAADVEAVVEHHVVHAAAVESVVGRAEVLLERAFRPVARPHAEVHVVVARDVEERDPARGEGLANRFEKRGLRSMSPMMSPQTTPSVGTPSAAVSRMSSAARRTLSSSHSK